MGAFQCIFLIARKEGGDNFLQWGQPLLTKKNSFLTVAVVAGVFFIPTLLRARIFQVFTRMRVKTQPRPEILVWLRTPLTTLIIQNLPVTCGTKWVGGGGGVRNTKNSATQKHKVCTDYLPKFSHEGT